MVVEMRFYYALVNRKILSITNTWNSSRSSKEEKDEEYNVEDDLHKKNSKLREKGKESWLLNRLRCWSCGLYQGDSDLCKNCEHKHCSIEEKNSN
jgi:hypothetical protein